MSRRLPAVYSLVLLLSLNSGLLARANRDQPSTAWRNNRFNMDVASIVSRSDIVLQRPNRKPDEAMPLGNGRLGLAVWSAGGLTIQLNRADTLPGRLSPGQVVLPGLERLASASNYSGRLDLYRGEFAERGGGLTATVYVHPDLDMAVVEVAGADPNSQQSATLLLWQPRRPEAFSHEGIAVLSETWKDSTEAGASGETFGTLAAITADAREVQAKPDGPVAVKLSFRPKADGSFRLLIAAPEWKGGDAMKRSAEMFAAKTSVVEHRHRWADLWNHTGLMKLSSQDGSANISRTYAASTFSLRLQRASAASRAPKPG